MSFERLRLILFYDISKGSFTRNIIIIITLVYVRIYLVGSSHHTHRHKSPRFGVYEQYNPVPHLIRIVADNRCRTIHITLCLYCIVETHMFFFSPKKTHSIKSKSRRCWHVRLNANNCSTWNKLWNNTTRKTCYGRQTIATQHFQKEIR